MYLLLLLLTLILWFIFFRTKSYTWKHIKNRFGHKDGNVKFFDMNLIDDEHNFRCITNNVNYGKLMENEIMNTSNTWMIKIDEHKCTPSDMELINYVRPLTVRNNEGLVLRIQSSPWRYHAHFDCYDQTIHILHGTKQWVLFNLKFDDYKNEIDFLDTVCGLDIDQLKTILDSNNIEYETIITHVGEKLFIPKGVYHFTQNSNNEGCIMLNTKNTKGCPILYERFKKIWPRWSKIGKE